MSERETLAALLHNEMFDSRPDAGEYDLTAYAMADRLIAAGVRLAPADTGLRVAADYVRRTWDAQGYIGNDYLVAAMAGPMSALRDALDAKGAKA